MKLDITDINKAFSPTNEIEDPEKFIVEDKIAPVLVQSKDKRMARFSDPILKLYAKKRAYIHEVYK